MALSLQSIVLGYPLTIFMSLLIHMYTGKYLKKIGKLDKLDESEEINACTVKITVDVDGKPEFGVNIRYPIETTFEKITEQLSAFAEENGFELVSEGKTEFLVGETLDTTSVKGVGEYYDVVSTSEIEMELFEDVYGATNLFNAVVPFIITD